MGFKKRDERPPWQQPRAAADAKKILAVIDADKFMNTSYSMMTARTGLSQRRVELAVLHIQRTTDELEYVNKGPQFSFRRKRPCNSEEEYVLGKDGVDGSNPSLGSIELPVRKVHYWPDGPAKAINQRRQSLWCGSVIGSFCWPNLRPITYYWTKDLAKVTCRRCKMKYARQEARKHLPDLVVGIVEIK